MATTIFEKFAATPEKGNKWGITNDRHELVTEAYLRRYIQCWCRSEHGFTLNRKANFDFFMTDAFIKPLVAAGIKTASRIGKAASESPLWGRAKTATPAVVAVVGDSPAATGESTTSEPVTGEQPAAADAPAAEVPVTEPAVVIETKQARRRRILDEAAARKEADIAAMKESLAAPAAEGNQAAITALETIAAIEAEDGDPVAEAQATDEVVEPAAE
jgi:hypothetical protein